MSTISIDTGSYSPFGETPGTPTKPEPTDADWTPSARLANKIPGSQLLREMKWTPERLQLAIDGYRFPKPIGRKLTEFGAPGDGEPFWSRAQIATWREEFLAFARTVK